MATFWGEADIIAYAVDEQQAIAVADSPTAKIKIDAGGVIDATSIPVQIQLEPPVNNITITAITVGGKVEGWRSVLRRGPVGDETSTTANQSLSLGSSRGIALLRLSGGKFSTLRV